METKVLKRIESTDTTAFNILLDEIRYGVRGCYQDEKEDPNQYLVLNIHNEYYSKEGEKEVCLDLDLTSLNENQQELLVSVLVEEALKRGTGTLGEESLTASVLSTTTLPPNFPLALLKQRAGEVANSEKDRGLLSRTWEKIAGVSGIIGGVALGGGLIAFGVIAGLVGIAAFPPIALAIVGTAAVIGLVAFAVAAFSAMRQHEAPTREGIALLEKILSGEIPLTGPQVGQKVAVAPALEYRQGGGPFDETKKEINVVEPTTPLTEPTQSPGGGAPREIKKPG